MLVSFHPVPLAKQTLLCNRGYQTIALYLVLGKFGWDFTFRLEEENPVPVLL